MFSSIHSSDVYAKLSGQQQMVGIPVTDLLEKPVAATLPLCTNCRCALTPVGVAGLIVPGVAMVARKLEIELWLP